LQQKKFLDLFDSSAVALSGIDTGNYFTKTISKLVTKAPCNRQSCTCYGHLGLKEIILAVSHWPRRPRQVQESLSLVAFARGFEVIVVTTIGSVNTAYWNSR
jgi:hypothetical protein